MTKRMREITKHTMIPIGTLSAILGLAYYVFGIEQKAIAANEKARENQKQVTQLAEKQAQFEHGFSELKTDTAVIMEKVGNIERVLLGRKPER